MSTDVAQGSVDLAAAVQRLRKRTHEIQEAADKRIAELSKTVEHWRASLALADSYMAESGVVFHSSVTRAKAASLFQRIAALEATLEHTRQIVAQVEQANSTLSGQNTGLAEDLETARTLLRRISQWDHMDSAGDGPYWRAEIAKVLDD